MTTPTLAEKKRLLVAESDAIRQEISARLDQVEASLSWIEPVIGIGRKVGKSGSIVAALGGLLVAWRLSRREKKKEEEAAAAGEKPGLLSRLVSGGLKAAGLIGPVLGVMRQMRG